jgi:formylglycine-generating enzyme required for sulfatase activity
MAGNVWEWCRDAWRDTYGNTMTKSVNPYHAGDQDSPRVVRGGSWSRDSGYLRSAFRGGFDPEGRRRGLGFRVVCRGSESLGWLDLDQP